MSVLAVAFVLGPIVTALPLGTYLNDPATWTFLWRNVLLVSPQFSLPGVFEDQPYTDVVGSIWTLFYEVACYFGIFVLGLLGALRHPRVLMVLLGIYMLVWTWVEMQSDPHHRLWAIQTLSLPFAIGTAFYVWRDRLPLHGGLIIPMLGFAALLQGSLFYNAGLALAISYTIFWLAYVPRGVIRAYNRMGDYSYGIYIYAFPLQGFAVWLMPGHGPLLNIALAAPMTLVCAIASWHWIEKPALTPSPTVGLPHRV